MMKAAVVYWSGTGNTAAMADLVLEGMREAGADASLIECTMVTDLAAYDAIAFGCPAMGSEQLEDSEFEPMFDGVKKSLGGKAVALFGSYGWGDGEWMRNWEDDCKAAGINLVCESVLVNGAPEGADAEACKELGKALA
ncbi:MAG: flavodoxin [Oscillospiraceae bacterium]|nr:flavodoxin [Oscillospiraceae bacterium]